MGVDTKKLRELATAASPGPWEVTETPGFGHDHAPYTVVDGHDEQVADCWDNTPGNRAPGQNEANAAFIAAANPALVAELLDLVENNTCARHADQKHGAEAEELRRGIESLIKDGFNSATRGALQRLLDRIDARDSLAYLEARDEKLAESERYRKSAEGKLDIMLDENKRVQAEFTAACREWIAERNTSTNRIARLESIAREAIATGVRLAGLECSSADEERLAALLEEVNGNG